MPSKPIRKQLIGLIFLLICLSLLLGTAATGSETLHVPREASTFEHKFRIVWAGIERPLRNREIYCTLDPNNGTAPLSCPSTTDSDGYVQFMVDNINK